jgi:TolB protein
MYKAQSRGKSMRTLFLLMTCTALIISSCGQKPQEESTDTAVVDTLVLEGETHLKNIRQLTFEGENAEAYLSFDETMLVMQASHGDMECDQIFSMTIDGEDMTMVSSGKGRTTCSYWYPDGETIIYSTTEAYDPGCMPPPDRSMGYVWKLYPEFDIYTIKSDGTDNKLLFKSDGYDAEATVSPMGDKIVFTSTKDGDPEIYTMNLDGSEVTRLTNLKGYDGGPFFSWDGTKIVFRANRPDGPEEEAAYQELVTSNLVRPTNLEIHIMDADGSNMVQVTDNGAANFAPFMHPDGKRIIFASNMASDSKRNFDLFIINTDGTGLERVTYFEAFDGFPMFTKDGKKLVFCSNRNNAKRGDTNVFVADWID